MKRTARFAKITSDVFVLLLSVMLIYTWHVLGQKSVKQHAAKVENELETAFDSFYLRTNVPELIRINSIGKVTETRQRLVEFLWGSGGLPRSMPTGVERNHVDSRYDDIDNLDRIDFLSIEMEYGLSSRVYHFIPKTSNQQIVLYHQGHGGDFFSGKSVISALLGKGYAVVGFSMPLLGMNNKPDVFIERFGWYQIERHDEMKLLLPKHGHPLKYFVEPVVRVVNYLKHSYDYSVIGMTGISGGGWTTTIVAAIDPRIVVSIPVAGTVPLYLRAGNETDWGDWEQTVPQFFRIANYLELYVLGSTGDRRKQLQIINLFDDCCFSGGKTTTYGEKVSLIVQNLGPGEYELYFDRSHHRHKISAEATSLIHKIMSGVSEGPSN
jgi:hypothetical protein